MKSTHYYDDKKSKCCLTQIRHTISTEMIELAIHHYIDCNDISAYQTVTKLTPYKITKKLIIEFIKSSLHEQGTNYFDYYEERNEYNFKKYILEAKELSKKLFPTFY